MNRSFGCRTCGVDSSSRPPRHRRRWNSFAVTIPGRVMAGLLAAAFGLASIFSASASVPSPRAAAAGSGRAQRILPPYTTTILPNGLTVLVMEQHELPLIDFHLLVKTGATADPKGREGLAAATAALLRSGGTKTLTATEFSEAVDFVGGTLEADANEDLTAIMGEFLVRDFQTGLSLLAEMVLAPGFRDEELERYRAQTLASIQQDLDDPETIADKQFAKSLFGGHPYARPVEGTRRSVTALGRRDLMRFYESVYAPNNAILAVVGDIDSKQALTAVRAAFGGWKKRPVAAPKPGAPTAVKGRRVIVVDKPDVTQTQIRIGTIGIRRADPLYFPAQIGATLLGGGFTSWLNQEIREKRGLSYGASSRFETRRDPGPFVVSTFTKNETVKETIDVALQTLARFKSGDIGKTDLEKAQNYRVGQYPLTVETTDQLARQIAELVFYGLTRDFVDRQIASLRAVKLADLRTVGARMPVEDYVMVIVTNAAAVRPQLEGFGDITVVPYDSIE